MNKHAIWWAFAAALALQTAPADARQERSSAAKREFRSAHPCPSSEKKRGPCPGYVIDHIEPLCAGGPDRSSNMQWQTIEEAKRKDRWERELCRRKRNSGAHQPDDVARPLPNRAAVRAYGLSLRIKEPGLAVDGVHQVVRRQVAVAVLDAQRAERFFLRCHGLGF